LKNIAAISPVYDLNFLHTRIYTMRCATKLLYSNFRINSGHVKMRIPELIYVFVIFIKDVSWKRREL